MDWVGELQLDRFGYKKRRQVPAIGFLLFSGEYSSEEFLDTVEQLQETVTDIGAEFDRTYDDPYYGLKCMKEGEREYAYSAEEAAYLAQDDYVLRSGSVSSLRSEESAVTVDIVYKEPVVSSPYLQATMELQDVPYDEARSLEEAVEANIGTSRTPP